MPRGLGTEGKKLWERHRRVRPERGAAQTPNTVRRLHDCRRS